MRLRELPRIEAIRCEASRAVGRPESIEAYLALITVAADAMARMEPLYADIGLSRGRFVVLMLLRNSDGASTPAELAHRASVTTATMTGLLDGLEAQGLVRREHRSDDRRSVRIELTPRATALLERFLPRHFEGIESIMKALTKGELATLTGLLVKIFGASEELAHATHEARTTRRPPAQRA